MADNKHMDDLVAHLSRLLDEHGLSELEYQKGTLRLRVARNLSAAPTELGASAYPIQAPGDDASVKDHDLSEHTVLSPMVGTVYLSPDPDQAAYIQLGSKVEKGAILMLIEAMKTFTPITARYSGTVRSIHIEDGGPVEFGDPLVHIEPT